MSNRGSNTAHAIKRNDWSSLVPPALPHWRPSLRVAVVVAGEPDQERLNLTLAALRHQTYPAELLDVVVVDHGPDPLLELGKLRPDRCRIVPAAGRSGFDAGVAATDADVIVRLETGVVAAPQLVAALARWQHVTPDAVSIAPPRLVTGWATADELADRSAAGTIDQLFPPSASTPHPELARLLDASNQLRAADHLGFLAVAGAPFAFHRERYIPASDPYQGADIEVGYRLAQAGAVFVPEPQASAWIVGAERDEAGAARHRRAELADLMPYPRGNRPAAARTWSVPLITAVVPADGPYELVRTCVDRLLGNDETDLRVLLVGDWALAGGSGNEELRLIAAEYRSEARVRLVDTAPATGYPSPYLLRVPSHLGVGVTTVRALVAAAERWQVGLIRVLPAGAASAAQSVELWRTDALSRALRTDGAAQQLAAAVARTHGQRWEAGSEYGVVDLSELPRAELRSPAPTRATGAATEPVRRRSGHTVEVGGARSLAKATVFVTRRYARAAKRRIVRR